MLSFNFSDPNFINGADGIEIFQEFRLEIRLEIRSQTAVDFAYYFSTLQTIRTLIFKCDIKWWLNYIVAQKKFHMTISVMGFQVQGFKITSILKNESPCLSSLNFWNIKCHLIFFSISSLKNQKINLILKLIFAGYTGSKNQLRTRQKIKFVPK